MEIRTTKLVGDTRRYAEILATDVAVVAVVAAVVAAPSVAFLSPKQWESWPRPMLAAAVEMLLERLCFVAVPAEIARFPQLPPVWLVGQTR